jgi:hypothetical protein
VSVGEGGHSDVVGSVLDSGEYGLRGGGRASWEALRPSYGDEVDDVYGILRL